MATLTHASAGRQVIEQSGKQKAAALQRKCACGTLDVTGQCGGCAKKQGMFQRKSAGTPDALSLPAAVNDGLRTPGQPLESGSRAFFESRFGHDFSGVRVHTGGEADRSARAVGALAYTVGNDIVFAANQHSPHTTWGRRLLAHELTHVLQQAQNGFEAQTKQSVGEPDTEAEREADRVADVIVAGQGQAPVAFSKPAALVQRACLPAGIGTPAGCGAGSPTFVSGSTFRFLKDCDDFAAGEEARLVSTVSALPATTTVEIHGFASADGDATFNENLSCARALKAQSVLTAPSPGGAGISGGRITGITKHGATPGPVADRRSVVIVTAGPTPPPPPPRPPLTVAITPVVAPTTPAGMPNRIPPRVDTIVGVGIVGWSPPMLPVTLSVDGAGGGNGSATINGLPTVDLTASSAINLRGVDQTDPGRAGNLSLVATQGSTRLATSNAFSVSSVPEDMVITFVRLVTGGSRGIVVRHTWSSDSGVVADLDQTDVSEQVEIDRRGGSLASIGLTTSGYLGTGTTSLTDTHSIPALSSSGFFVAKQTEMFKDQRTGAVDIPMKNSGYRLGHFITAIPGTGFLGIGVSFEATAMKFGFANTANGIRSDAGSGSVTRTQPI